MKLKLPELKRSAICTYLEGAQWCSYGVTLLTVDAAVANVECKW